MSKLASPTLLKEKAFNAPQFASWRLNQKLINKKEAKPTISQPINIHKKFAELTNKSIEKEKKIMYKVNRKKLGSGFIYPTEKIWINDEIIKIR